MSAMSSAARREYHTFSLGSTIRRESIRERIQLYSLLSIRILCTLIIQVRVDARGSFFHDTSESSMSACSSRAFAPRLPLSTSATRRTMRTVAVIALLALATLAVATKKVRIRVLPTHCAALRTRARGGGGGGGGGVDR
jgi:hypothetical protein